MQEPVAKTPRPLEDPIGQPAMLVARLGFGAGEKRLTDDEGTGTAGQLAVGRIDVGEADATRNRESGGRVGSERLPHEVGPDWEGGLRSTEAVSLAVIEADPDDGEKAGRVADEPGVAPVVARAGLARYLTRGAQRRHGGRCSASDHPLEQRGHEISFGGGYDVRRGLVLGGEHWRAVGLIYGAHRTDRVGPTAVARERDIGPRQFERRDLERSEGHGGHGRQVRPKPERAARLDDHGKADGLGDPHRGAVERLLEGAAEAHAPRVALLVVAGAPRLAVDHDGERRIVDHGRGRESGLTVARVQSRQVHERLEGGAHLPSGQRHTIELARLVVTATYQGADLAGGGIDRDQSDLEPGTRILAAEPGKVAFELVEPARHRILGKALERDVEGGGDSGAEDGSFLEFLADVVGEVRSGLAGPRSRGSAHRVPARALVRRGVEHGQLMQSFENDVAPLARPVRIQYRRVRVWRTHHPGQERRLAGAELVNLLGEVDARGCPDPPDRQGTALAEINLVQIRLEDLWLRVPPFDQNGQPGLLQLPQDRPLAGQQSVLDELLCDGASALHPPSAAKVGPCRPRDGPHVESTVLEEPMILGGEHGVDEGLRRFGEPDRAIVLSGPIAHARQHLTLEGGALDVLAVAGDARDALSTSLETDLSLSIAREDVPPGSGSVKLSGRGRQIPGLCVSKAGERSGQIDQADLHAWAQRLSGGVHDHGAPGLDPREPGELDRRVDSHHRHWKEDESGEAEGKGVRLSPREDFH